MKTLNLKVAGRFAALTVFNDKQVKVKTENLKQWIDDASKFGITDEEKVELEWKEIKDDTGAVTSVTWTPAKDAGKDIEISDFSAQLLLDKLSALEISAFDPLAAPILDFIEKLK